MVNTQYILFEGMSSEKLKAFTYHPPCTIHPILLALLSLHFGFREMPHDLPSLQKEATHYSSAASHIPSILKALLYAGFPLLVLSSLPSAVPGSNTPSCLPFRAQLRGFFGETFSDLLLTKHLSLSSLNTRILQPNMRHLWLSFFPKSKAPWGISYCLFQCMM